MSRIGRLPITIPEGVKVDYLDKLLKISGPKGSLDLNLSSNLSIMLDGGTILVSRSDDSKRSRSLHGLYRTLIANMIIGVTDGYIKDLEIIGTGYRANQKGKSIELSLGFSHTVTVDPPEGIEFQLPDQTNIKVIGIDKQLVGETAARIRKLKKPEPYKGKGIKYKDEIIRRKVGKAGG